MNVSSQAQYFLFHTNIQKQKIPVFLFVLSTYLFNLEDHATYLYVCNLKQIQKSHIEQLNLQAISVRTEGKKNNTTKILSPNAPVLKFTLNKSQMYF